MLIIKFWADDEYNDFGLDNYTITSKNDLILYFPRKDNGEMYDPEDFYHDMEYTRKNYLESEDYQKIEILEGDEDEENLITALHSKYALEQISTCPNFFQVELKKKIVEDGNSGNKEDTKNIIIEANRKDVGVLDWNFNGSWKSNSLTVDGQTVDFDFLVKNYKNIQYEFLQPQEYGITKYVGYINAIDFTNQDSTTKKCQLYIDIDHIDWIDLETQELEERIFIKLGQMGAFFVVSKQFGIDDIFGKDTRQMSIHVVRHYTEGEGDNLDTFGVLEGSRDFNPSMTIYSSGSASWYSIISESLGQRPITLSFEENNASSGYEILPGTITMSCNLTNVQDMNKITFGPVLIYSHRTKQFLEMSIDHNDNWEYELIDDRYISDV